jgi:hypothetical protein
MHHHVDLVSGEAARYKIQITENRGACECGTALVLFAIRWVPTSSQTLTLFHFSFRLALWKMLLPENLEETQPEVLLGPRSILACQKKQALGSMC